MKIDAALGRRHIDRQPLAALALLPEDIDDHTVFFRAHAKTIGVVEISNRVGQVIPFGVVAR